MLDIRYIINGFIFLEEIHELRQYSLGTVLTVQSAG